MKIIENEKELRQPLSEVCDFHGVEYAAYLLGKYCNYPFINLRRGNPVIPFEIASLPLPEAIMRFGAETTLRYIYDWAEYEIENLDSDGYDELNLFIDKVYEAGGYQAEG